MILEEIFKKRNYIIKLGLISIIIILKLVIKLFIIFKEYIYEINRENKKMKDL